MSVPPLSAATTPRASPSARDAASAEVGRSKLGAAKRFVITVFAIFAIILGAVYVIGEYSGDGGIDDFQYAGFD